MPNDADASLCLPQGQNKRLQQATERLELELLHARTADLNGVHSDDEGGDGDGPSAALRQRYERTLRELEFTKRRLQQQHEDDLEQLVGLKKQLEKKVRRRGRVPPPLRDRLLFRLFCLGF